MTPALASGGALGQSPLEAFWLGWLAGFPSFLTSCQLFFLFALFPPKPFQLFCASLRGWNGDFAFVFRSVLSPARCIALVVAEAVGKAVGKVLPLERV